MVPRGPVVYHILSAVHLITSLREIPHLPCVVGSMTGGGIELSLEHLPVHTGYSWRRTPSLVRNHHKPLGIRAWGSVTKGPVCCKSIRPAVNFPA